MLNILIEDNTYNQDMLIQIFAKMLSGDKSTCNKVCISIGTKGQYTFSCPIYIGETLRNNMCDSIYHKSNTRNHLMWLICKFKIQLFPTPYVEKPHRIPKLEEEVK
jgi:hypothetical protein